MARQPHTARQALSALAEKGSEANRKGMARFGISTGRAYGVPMPAIRAVARQIEPDHHLAEALWQSGVHEARILAALVDRPQWVTAAQMDRWTAEFDSWDLCDQVCGNLWDRAACRDRKISEWMADDREFVRRAAFATMAWRAVHDKEAADTAFLDYLPMIRRAAGDNRNFVRKAVNWALRQIGKRSAELHRPALDLARELATAPETAPRWIGRNATLELESAKVLSRLGLPNRVPSP